MAVNPAIHGFNAFYGVTAVAADDVWAAGTTRNNEPLTEHWDGARWAIIPVSVPDGEELAGVAAAGATDVRAIGVFPLPHTVVLAWEGSQWSDQSTPPTPKTHGGFEGIAYGAGAYWAVGWTGMNHKLLPLIERACVA